jgi:hypothetical protein
MGTRLGSSVVSQLEASCDDRTGAPGTVSEIASRKLETLLFLIVVGSFGPETTKQNA